MVNLVAQITNLSPGIRLVQEAGGRGNERVIDGYIWERDDKGGWNNTGRKAK